MYVQETLAHLRCNANRALHLQSTRKQVSYNNHVDPIVTKFFEESYIAMHLDIMDV